MGALVTLVALFFLVMGVVALAQPERVTRLFGTPALAVDGRNEVRAVYGGFGVAMAGLLLEALRDASLRPGVLVCLAAALLGMATGRVVSRLVDGRAGFYPRLFCAVEVVLAAALLWALRLAG